MQTKSNNQLQPFKKLNNNKTKQRTNKSNYPRNQNQNQSTVIKSKQLRIFFECCNVQPTRQTSNNIVECDPVGRVEYQQNLCYSRK